MKKTVHFFKKLGNLKLTAVVATSLFIFSCSPDETQESEELNNAIPIPLTCDVNLDAALDFNAFVRNGISLTSGDSEGPLAMGGDLTLNGLFTAAAHTSGTLFFNGENQASSLIVNGSVNYDSSEEGIHLNNGFVKIGDLSGSVVHDTDENGVVNNTRVTQGTYNDQPRIHVQRNQDATTVGVDNIIDFEAAFVALDSTSVFYSELPNNVTIQEVNKIDLLENSFNVLHITGEELNNLSNFTFNDQPTATSPLIINVDAEGDFIWDVQNQAGIGDQQGAHIVFNFFNNAGSITLAESGATVIGTILAPNAAVTKLTSGNINGQVIADSYTHVSGEIHQHVFNICEDNPCDLFLNLNMLEDSLTLVPGESFTLSATTNFEDATFVWSTDEISATIEVSPIETTTYTVTATLDNGCTITDTITIDLDVDLSCLSQEFNVSAATFIENFTDVLNIDIAIAEGQSVTYTINDMSGTVVLAPTTADLSSGCNTLSVNLDSELFTSQENNDFTLIVTGEAGWTETIGFSIN